MSLYFITGIDTDSGKTVAAGLFARYLLNLGKNVITQKLVQTGCDGISDDIKTHRNLMGTDLLKHDLEGTTCPYVFKFPASPHLAAAKENRTIDTNIIKNATELLLTSFDNVILEGVGGVHVPLTEKITTLDYIKSESYPVIVVTSSKLGSINHTLLTLDVLSSRKIKVSALIYNLYPDENLEIRADSKEVFKRYMVYYGYKPNIIDLPVIRNNTYPKIDFSNIIG